MTLFVGHCAAVEEHCSCAVCLALITPKTSGDSITPQQTEVTETEGKSVTLRCNYQTSYVQYLFWYHQKSGSRPQLLMEEHSAQTEKLKFIHEKEKQEFHLEISSAAVTDSAVYYCAVRPTVTGNTKTLYKNLWSKDNRILHNIH
uniref:Ig-like domain-containing protein n=1 Tax=Oreochromis niloticus TaxID=8128 RepID=A0A669DI97_ORENI